MNLILEKLTLLCTFSGMELDLSHISGERNEEADALSSWDGSNHPRFQHLLQNRFPISLSQLLHPDVSVSVYPPEAFCLGSFPKSRLGIVLYIQPYQQTYHHIRLLESYTFYWGVIGVCIVCNPPA